jgi:hypothetical protein
LNFHKNRTPFEGQIVSSRPDAAGDCPGKNFCRSAPQRLQSPPSKSGENAMGASGPRRSDSSVDAIATVVVLTVIVTAVSLWLAGMPS